MTNLTLTTPGSLIGAAFQGQAISAVVPAADQAQFAGATYVWTVGGKDVSTGTSNVYVPTEADVGKFISASASVTGTAPLASANALDIANVNDRPTGTVRIEGDTTTAGAVLHAVDTIADADGLNAFTYEWFAAGSGKIAGADGPDLAVGTANAGSTFGVRVTYTDQHGTKESVYSTPVPPPDVVDTPLPLVSGTVAAGETLYGGVQDSAGTGAPFYRWQTLDAGGNVVSETNGRQLVLGAAPAPVRILEAYADDDGTVKLLARTLGTAGGDRLQDVGTTFMRDARHGYEVIDGGAGIDTWIAPAGWTPSLGIGSASHRVQLENIERIEAPGVDGAAATHVAIDTGIGAHAGAAYRLYQAAFDRAPEAAGLGFWIAQLDAGLGLEDAANAFIASDEFRSLYGASPTNAGIVAAFYENVLHRAPDAAGTSYWTDALDRKIGTVADVLIGFSESGENVAALTGVMQHGIAYVPYAGG